MSDDPPRLYVMPLDAEPLSLAGDAMVYATEDGVGKAEPAAGVVSVDFDEAADDDGETLP